MAALVGRSRELLELDRTLAAARDGQGRLVLVSGPAGIGKSCLVDVAAQAAAARGMVVLRGCAIDDPGAPPLWPWRRALSHLLRLDELPTAEVGESDAAARFRLFVTISDRLVQQARADGLVVVLEDMHWADATSLRLLRHLAAELPGTRLAVLVTARSGDGPLTQALPDLARGEAYRAVELAGLHRAEVVAWLPQLTGRVDVDLAAELHRVTGGNPLLIRLIASDLAGSASEVGELLAARPQLRRSIAGRVRNLPPAVQRVVQAASVLGERIHPAGLEAMVGHDVTEALEFARASGILRDQAFEHALVRDAVYADLPPHHREQLHRAAARVLEQDPATPPGVVAGHWRRAGDLARCLPWALRADEEARASLAFDEALRHAELAVTCARATGSDVAVPLLRLAEALALDGHFEGSAATCIRAASAAERAGRVDVLAAAALVVQGVGSPSALGMVLPVCERALARLPAEEHVLRARLLAQRAVAVAETGGGDDAGELAALALAEAERTADPDALLEAIAARHLTITVPATVAERRELGARAAQLAAASDRPMAALWGHLWQIDAAVQLGDLQEAERELAELDRITRERGLPLGRWHHLRHRAALQALVGDFPAARRSDADAEHLAERMDDVSLHGMSVGFRTALATLRGDPDELSAHLEQMLAVAPSIPLVRVTRPLVHALEGDLDRARAEFAEFRHLPDTLPVGIRWMGTLTQIGITAILLGDGPVADGVRRRFAPFTSFYSGDGSGAVFHGGSVAGLVGDLARVAGRLDDARELYSRAVEMNLRIGARPFTATARLGWAQTLAAQGSGLHLARHLVDQAATEFERLDMPGPLQQAEALRSELVSRQSPSPLTAREQEVAHLVATALPNREIARRLFLSERTVESHVRSILAKLGFTTRTQVATWVLEQRSPAPSDPGAPRPRADSHPPASGARHK